MYRRFVTFVVKVPKWSTRPGGNHPSRTGKVVEEGETYYVKIGVKYTKVAPERIKVSTWRADVQGKERLVYSRSELGWSREGEVKEQKQKQKQVQIQQQQEEVKEQKQEQVQPQQQQEEEEKEMWDFSEGEEEFKAFQRWFHNRSLMLVPDDEVEEPWKFSKIEKDFKSFLKCYWFQRRSLNKKMNLGEEEESKVFQRWFEIDTLVLVRECYQPKEDRKEVMKKLVEGEAGGSYGNQLKEDREEVIKKLHGSGEEEEP